jgi:hypothetical protein
MTRLLTLTLALAFAVIGLVTVKSSAAAAGSGKRMAEISLTGLSDLPNRFGGAHGGVLGDHR